MHLVIKATGKSAEEPYRCPGPSDPHTARALQGCTHQRDSITHRKLTGLSDVEQKLCVQPCMTCVHTCVCVWPQSCLIFLHYSHTRANNCPQKLSQLWFSPPSLGNPLSGQQLGNFLITKKFFRRNLTQALSRAQGSQRFTRAGDRIKSQWHLVITNVSQGCYQ